MTKTCRRMNAFSFCLGTGFVDKAEVARGERLWSPNCSCPRVTISVATIAPPSLPQSIQGPKLARPIAGTVSAAASTPTKFAAILSSVESLNSGANVDANSNVNDPSTSGQSGAAGTLSAMLKSLFAALVQPASRHAAEVSTAVDVDAKGDNQRSQSGPPIRLASQKQKRSDSEGPGAGVTVGVSSADPEPLVAMGMPSEAADAPARQPTEEAFAEIRSSDGTDSQSLSHETVGPTPRTDDAPPSLDNNSDVEAAHLSFTLTIAIQSEAVKVAYAFPSALLTEATDRSHSAAKVSEPVPIMSGHSLPLVLPASAPLEGSQTGSRLEAPMAFDPGSATRNAEPPVRNLSSIQPLGPVVIGAIQTVLTPTPSVGNTPDAHPISGNAWADTSSLNLACPPQAVGTATVPTTLLIQGGSFTNSLSAIIPDGPSILVTAAAQAPGRGDNTSSETANRAPTSPIDLGPGLNGASAGAQSETATLDGHLTGATKDTSNPPADQPEVTIESASSRAVGRLGNATALSSAHLIEIGPTADPVPVRNQISATTHADPERIPVESVDKAPEKPLTPSRDSIEIGRPPRSEKTIPEADLSVDAGSAKAEVLATPGTQTSAQAATRTEQRFLLSPVSSTQVVAGSFFEPAGQIANAFEKLSPGTPMPAVEPPAPALVSEASQAVEPLLNRVGNQQSVKWGSNMIGGPLSIAADPASAPVSMGTQAERAGAGTQPAAQLETLRSGSRSGFQLQEPQTQAAGGKPVSGLDPVPLSPASTNAGALADGPPSAPVSPAQVSPDNPLPVAPALVQALAQPHLVQPPHATVASQIAIRLDSSDDSGHVELRIRERAGEVQISVRSTDQATAATLRQDLGDLVQRLHSRGATSDLVRPDSSFAELDGQRARHHAAPDSSRGDPPYSDDAQHQRRQQQQQRRAPVPEAPGEVLEELRNVFSDLAQGVPS